MTGQVEWRTQRQIGPEAGTHRLVYDSTRGRVLLLTRQNGPPLSIWEWDGALWREIGPSSGPPGYTGFAAAYDSARRRVVVFGDDGKTWEWDGAGWARVATGPLPGARFGTNMAYDAARQRTVLFGGQGGRDDTWEWDGQRWTQRFPATVPPARNVHSMAYDAARQRIVMFGGGAIFDDTWEWDGTDWREGQPGTRPPGRHSGDMAYDVARRRIVLYGGTGGAGPVAQLGDTWEWDGTNWVQRTPAHSPGTRDNHRMAYDATRQRTVLFGGIRTRPGLSRPLPAVTFEWDGTDWNRVPPAALGPRHGMASAYDALRDRVIWFGGDNRATPLFDDTWEWTPGGLRQLQPARRPSGRCRAAMAYDPVRDRIVLFGGANGAYPTGAFGDTWEWDGTTWIERTVALAPPPRFGHGMAWDPVRGRVLLFGGDSTSAFGGELDDTWEWDGTQWRLLLPSASPSPRADAAMATDAGRGRIVLYGGGAGFSRMGDTWEWEGTNWVRRAAASPPGAAFWPALAYDAARVVTVLQSSAETWEWNGTSWTRRTSAASPPAATGPAAFAYHAGSGRAVLLVDTGTQYVTELWDYGPIHPATYRSFGNGCAGSAGTPSLVGAAGSLPWLGQTLSLQLTSVLAGQPAAVWVGGSRTQWQGLTLPLELRAAGMPGCELLASPEVPVAVGTAGGTATLTVPLCVCASALGLSVFGQAAVADPGANPAGVVISNGIEAQIGGR
ncbi:MAG: hypothetical protein AAF628_15405 [Planctomycetota bacterium]